MLKFYFTFIIIIIGGICNYSTAQTDETLSVNDSIVLDGDPVVSQDSIIKKDSVVVINDYNLALKEYLALYENNKEDLRINYLIGLCYLNINDDKSRAIPFLEYTYNQGYNDEVLLNLGLAYMYSYKFDDAISFFEDYRTIISSKKAELVANYYEDLRSGKLDYQKKITTGIYSLVDRYIENCENAKELIKSPLNVTFENLGKEVNSKYADFFPFVTQNQEKLYFTSRREENPLKLVNDQGYFTSDIYVSEVKDGQWAKPVNMGPVVNSIGDEQCVSLMPNGKNMIIFQDNDEVMGDIFTVPLNKLDQAPPLNFEQPVNTEFREFEGCVTEDENILIISTDREGGYGETDLYMFHKLSNGNWGAPVNLGRQINTKYKEAFPMYDHKNHTLYFASQGHTNMGGFDIFKSYFDTINQKFTPPENIGYPINTPEDDMVFSLSGNKRDAYVSAVRKGGFGDLDIYKVVFGDIENRPSVIKGNVSLNDLSEQVIEINNSTVTITNAKTKTIIDSKKVNPQNGRFIFAVEPGSYILKASCADYNDFEDEINVYDKSDYVFEIEKNILLEKNNDSVSSTNEMPNEGLTKSKTIIRGKITTNDSLEQHIDAFVAILDVNTCKKLEGKTVNPQSGRYFFALYPGAYILTVTSPGYADFEKYIDVREPAGYNFEIQKNE